MLPYSAVWAGPTSWPHHRPGKGISVLTDCLHCSSLALVFDHGWENSYGVACNNHIVTDIPDILKKSIPEVPGFRIFHICPGSYLAICLLFHDLDLISTSPSYLILRWSLMSQVVSQCCLLLAASFSALSMDDDLLGLPLVETAPQ